MDTWSAREPNIALTQHFQKLFRSLNQLTAGPPCTHEIFGGRSGCRLGSVCLMPPCARKSAGHICGTDTDCVGIDSVLYLTLLRVYLLCGISSLVCETRLYFLVTDLRRAHQALSCGEPHSNLTYLPRRMQGIGSAASRAVWCRIHECGTTHRRPSSGLSTISKIISSVIGVYFSSISISQRPSTFSAFKRPAQSF